MRQWDVSGTGEHNIKLTKNQLKHNETPPSPPSLDASPQLGLSGVFVSLKQRTFILAVFLGPGLPLGWLLQSCFPEPQPTRVPRLMQALACWFRCANVECENVRDKVWVSQFFDAKNTLSLSCPISTSITPRPALGSD